MRLVFALLACLELAQSNDDDLFNYRETVDRDFGPKDWNKVTCDDVDTCTGWPDDWKLGVRWKLNKNSCKHCPESGSSCGSHHQSPINLERNRAIEGHAMENECIDVHWMKYEDSTCTWDHLEKENSFSIERHALKITQPIEALGESTDSYRVKCPGDDGRLFGRIDFSKGFSQWWFLSHIDFKVPSEHTQEGKRYSAEVQMAHFYSVSGEVAGVDNEMATVAIFLEAYDDAPPYKFLDRLICEWREAEDRTRQQCGLDSVDPYPGCFSYGRGQTPFPTTAQATPEPTTPAPSGITPTVEPVELPGAPTEAPAPTKAPIRETEAPVTIVSPQRSSGLNTTRRLLRNRSANDILIENWEKEEHEQGRIKLDPENFRQPDRTDEEWAEWIEAYSARDRGVATEHQRKLLDKDERRKLVEGDVIPFHNYQFLIDSKTEYYYRYSGSQTVPPCYGPFTPGSRGNTNHWRVMKDPIRVHPRQIAEMERLLKERIAPPDAPKHACKNDTAGKIDEEGHISVARPLMKHSTGHYKTFCECDDWQSKWPEDRAWCKKGNERNRLYDHPYNFGSGGIF